MGVEEYQPGYDGFSRVRDNRPPLPGPVTHIAAQPIEALGRYFRQRCAWCGAVLVDYDYANVSVLTDQRDRVLGDDKPKGFAVGALVRVEGAFPVVQTVVEAERLPDDWCGAALFPVDR